MHNSQSYMHVYKSPILPSRQERRILEETVTPLTPRSSALPSPSRGELSSTSEPHDTIVRSLADWERKQEMLERQSVNSSLIDYGWFISLWDASINFVSVARITWAGTLFLDWLDQLTVRFFWLVDTEGKHRERGMETKRKRQDQWHQHCWRQHENRQKVCELCHRIRRQ